MRKIVLLILIFSGCGLIADQLFSQPEVPTEVLPPVSAGNQEIEQLINQGSEVLYSDPEQSLQLFERAEFLAAAANDRHLLAKVNQSLSIYYWARGDFQKASVCDRKALSYYQSLGDQSGIAYALNGLAVTLTDMGLNHEALKNLLESENLFLGLKDSIALQMIYLNLGVVSDHLKDFDAAMEYYHKSLMLGLHLEMYTEMADVYNNMAEISLQEKKYDQAYDYYQKAAQIYSRGADEAGITLVKGNLADYFCQIEKYDSAAIYYNLALEGYQQIADKHGECGILLGLGELYRLTNQYQKSESYLNATKEMASENQYLELFIDVQYQLALLKYEQKKYNDAYTHFLEYDAAKDSLYREASSTEFNNLRMIYEAEEKARALEALKEQNEKEQIINLHQDRLRDALLAIVALLILFLFTGVYFYLRLKAANDKLYKHQVTLKSKNKEIVETADQLKLANARLMNEKKLAEISSEAKAEFVSVLSHEIRTPLNAIIGISHALKEEIQDAEQNEYLGALIHSANTLLGFTNNILELSRLDAGKIEPREETFHLRHQIGQIIRSFEPALKEKNLVLTTHIDQTVPKTVTGDKMKLTQILLNLISNAVKYTDAGEIQVTIHGTPEADEHTWISFEVKDTGSGITPKLQPKIFDRYSRLQYESTLTPQGSGLGLSITKSLVDLLGGTITFESEMGVGSTFWVRLRFNTTPKSGYAPVISVPEGKAHQVHPLDGKKLLLVEDNEVNVMFTERLLKKLHTVVEVARDGEEAIVKAKQNRYDLILMDLQMPKLNGIDAAAAILKDYPETRIIALTANTDQHIQLQLRDVGFKDLLIKPFNPTELGEKIGYWIYS